MSEIARLQFVRQQGFSDATAVSCRYQYPALMFQPRVMVPIVLLGILTRSATVFLLLAAVLWWNALAPQLNPFDALYNRIIAAVRKSPPIGPAPAPRRFAQGMAGTFFVGVGLALLAGRHVVAWILVGMLTVALAALVFGRFCLGSYLYHLLRGDTGYANRTLPWSRAK
jgi:hypothetical protein